MTKNPVVEVKTDLGSFYIELFPDKAPITVENFLKYIDAGFYDGLIFHRIIPGFVVQGGGFDENMNYKKPLYPPIKNEAKNGLRNSYGTVAMARTTEIDSATSQFFINLAENYQLDHQGETPDTYGYAVFGKVIEGMKVVEWIARIPTTSKMGFENVPIHPVKIHYIKRVENR
ncbi:peptidylprolyl isomerase [Hydrogenothermus marinus]|uniref:Peptidyl-prolyl cis-trans isomerase n=1 Tax=Hydrogenothermus marinus TaxID=133270 RepID=A0A3M0BJB5_9AQUI|nr:peptidylprolyl isomerase [Hydrogenothermus marinus]RMA97301.1 peptidyl-prolyl cis-trans isomerase B (cyclophilin B) [Hydrogenothermus marinus]